MALIWGIVFALALALALIMLAMLIGLLFSAMISAINWDAVLRFIAPTAFETRAIEEILEGGRVLFLEVKSLRGRLSPAQSAFRDAAQGWHGRWCARQRMRWTR
ncbi:hypothetical protein ACFQXB_16400 [Plastorhodobacter daqingensis]|uniref:NERD domain-containing protein n=1 Tax=Plastorhodobacter daqingensis TaxID=1387281 RepID=A0ABW2UNT4_9RHOB